MKHIHVPAGRRSGLMHGNDWLKVDVQSGVNTSGTITVSGIKVGDVIMAVTDLTTPAAATLSEYAITADDTITYSGAADQSLLDLQILWCKNND